MIVKRMQATFGALQNRTLAPTEGLNIIQAPNEGGKSTWSAFLRAMLYGMSTKERDRQGYLAEKNRYQPWSGAAMEGAVELVWQGREITLRRGQKGAVPFGKFEAVYTKTGEPVPGLTGENCGETLLGVPREVFERSAFVGQGAAAIDGAPALEARVAALCSSGEEDVSYSQVQRRLKDWKNYRQHNKTGLIPKLEGELAVLEDTLQRQAKAHRLAEESRRELERLETERARLSGELAAHDNQARQERRRRYQAAADALAAAQAEADGLQGELSRHGTPPDRDTLRRAQEDLNYLNTVNANLKLAERQREEAETSAQEAARAAEHPLFPGMTADEAWHAATAAAQTVEAQSPRRLGYCLAALLLLGGVAAALVGLLVPWSGRAIAFLPAAVLVVAGAILLGRVLRHTRRTQAERVAVLTHYEVTTADDILACANTYRERCVVAAEAEKKRQAVDDARQQLAAQRDELREKLLTLTHTFAPEVTDVFGVSAAISRALGLVERFATAQVRLEGARRLCESLPPPGEGGEQAGDIAPRFDPAETAARLSATDGELTRLRGALAMARGELNTRGDPALFRARREELLEELERRRGEHDAIAQALETLEEAHGKLQERFSPALNRRAGELMAALTGGKYTGVSLSRQFEAAAEQAGEMQPRRALALSQGTADQLYLAVRLAVCDLALPQEDTAPLVLDDALTNFDERRMAMALACLAELGKTRQVLLFTCHGREAAWAQETGCGHITVLQSPGEGDIIMTTE